MNRADPNEWFRHITATMIERDPPKEGDYEKDGILYCGVCKEPKREYFDMDGEKILTVRDCKCRRDEREQERRREEYERKQERIKNIRRRSLMDSVFENSTFASFVRRPDNERVYGNCIKYVRHFPQMFEENQGLLFTGPVGTGKSYAAACIANALMENLRTVVMTSFIKILQQISTFNNDEQSIIEDLMVPDLLILDDLGAERSTDFALEKVYNIIDSRYRARKPIILTTNLTVQEMKQSTDIRYMRIYDRVFEMCYPITFEGVSRRKLEAKSRYDRMKKFFDEGDE